MYYRKIKIFQNELLCILIAQRAAKLPDAEVWGPREWSDVSTIQVRYSALNPKCQIFFSKLKFWHLVVSQPFDLQELTVPHLKIHFFLQHNILKICIAVLLRWFMWDQSNPIFSGFGWTAIHYFTYFYIDCLCLWKLYDTFLNVDISFLKLFILQHPVLIVFHIKLQICFKEMFFNRYF